MAAALVSCSRTDAPKPESLALTQDQIATEVARQVALQLASTQPSEAQAPSRRERNEARRERGEAEQTQAGQATVWKPGDPGPNGGLVYYAQDGEFYEAMAPGNTVGFNDSLPAGWTTPDMEDLGLIYQGLQKSGAADYGAVYYISVSKSGGKNRFLKMSDGAEAVGLSTGRNVGVRKFDPSQPPAELSAAALVIPTASPVQAAPTTAPASPAPAPASAAKYAIGAAGPGGGIVYSASGGKYKEITRPENAVLVGYEPPAGWTIPSIPELKLAYTALHAKVDFGSEWYLSSSGLNYRGVGTNYTRDHASLNPGQTDYDRSRVLFPNASFILAGGGAGSVHLMRFTDGRIILVGEDWVYQSDEEGNATSYGFYEFTGKGDPASAKYPDDYTLRLLHFLYIREWSE
ncbi:hypothetical protein AGMMS49546_05670 [Spirochaetia bacterium]|nr:hypothetical protein AGMMS49546_05670 [Spirochaetia bacterium]